MKSLNEIGFDAATFAVDSETGERGVEDSDGTVDEEFEEDERGKRGGGALEFNDFDNVAGMDAPAA
jgi:hypothetical protein